MIKVTNTDQFGNKLDADQMLRKFKRLVDAEGIIQKCRDRRYFLPKAMKRKLKHQKHQALMNKLRKGNR